VRERWPGAAGRKTWAILHFSFAQSAAARHDWLPRALPFSAACVRRSRLVHPILTPRELWSPCARPFDQLQRPARAVNSKCSVGVEKWAEATGPARILYCAFDGVGDGDPVPAGLTTFWDLLTTHTWQFLFSFSFVYFFSFFS
jgi:hypothetical protein